ncbi:hypothetical protein [Neobacillus drentensis]|uniref:hypothetical protein n=1 Tax=Neobacillus drentensis TaxID=220684 RepID=UPI0028675C1D|nr:hypothetical protein [Neobacillus drentensis]MDR7240058.1 hypothetical protein [Neobacillus drentensis]
MPVSLQNTCRRERLVAIHACLHTKDLRTGTISGYSCPPLYKIPADGNDWQIFVPASL